jgi:hypothetical protein
MFRGRTKSRLFEGDHPIDQHEQSNQQEQNLAATRSVRRQPQRLIRNRVEQADRSAQTAERQRDSSNGRSLKTWFHTYIL